jgi:subtilase family serine protease
VQLKDRLVPAVVSLVAIAVTALPTVASAAAEPAAEYAPVCSHALPAGAAGCDAVELLNPAANWHGIHAPGDRGAAPGKKPGGEPFPGYFPTELRSAYGLTSASAERGAGRTVAVVDAYDDPNAEADLAAYRERFGLPSCTASNGCFAKVDQEGGGGYPNASASWSEEIALDLDMVSAICPNCHILLVEASSNSMANLAAAASYAASHASAVSNSYGGSEFAGETGYDSSYHHPGVAIAASSGDGGYGVEYPAASPYVTAVGGTTLNRSSSTRGWSESVWSGSGAGCSAVEPNPGWQPVTSQCTRRTVADAAAVANPNTGVAVYDTYNEPGWMVFGGTSVASPILASVYALAEDAVGVPAQALYGAPLNRVAEGTDLNTRRCGTSYLCNAGYSLTGWTNALEAAASGWYNGPTGNGTPSGLAGF